MAAPQSLYGFPPVAQQYMAQMQAFWAYADADRSGRISIPELATLPFPGKGPSGIFSRLSSFYLPF